LDSDIVPVCRSPLRTIIDVFPYTAQAFSNAPLVIFCLQTVSIPCHVTVLAKPFTIFGLLFSSAWEMLFYFVLIHTRNRSQINKIILSLNKNEIYLNMLAA
jgi:hypothetical protein